MSFFRYPGGKYKLKDQIIECLSRYSSRYGLQYREPFLGGGEIGLQLLSKNPKIGSIWINDKDVGVACIWTSVIRYVNDFKTRIREFTPSVMAFHEFKQELSALTTMPRQRRKIVDIGFKKLAIHQISYSGLGTKSGGPLGGEHQKSEYKIDCRWSPDHICQKADKIHNRLCHILVYKGVCTNLDFEEVITPDDHDSLLYLDPPYFVKGNNLYQHGFTEDDHRRLAELLRSSKHTWVLSYDDCPQIRELYKWASFYSLDVKYSITARKDGETGERGSRIKPELLICSSKEVL